MKVIDKHLISKIGGEFGGLVSGSIMSIMNGEFPSEALTQFATQYVIQNFFLAESPLFHALAKVNFDLTFQLTTIAIGMVGSVLNGAVGGIVFNKCKSKIAQDNIIHLTDILLSYDRNRTAHLKFGVTQYSETGELIEATDEYGFPVDNPETFRKPTKFVKNYYPLQIFSDFSNTIEDKITPKAKEKFDYIWYEDRFDFLNVFVKECEDRENPYLSTCEEAIHVGF